MMVTMWLLGSSAGIPHSDCFGHPAQWELNPKALVRRIIPISMYLRSSCACASMGDLGMVSPEEIKGVAPGSGMKGGQWDGDGVPPLLCKPRADAN